VTSNPTTAHDILVEAAIVAGLPSDGAKLIRDGTNVMYRLPGKVVARIGRAGSEVRATRETLVSHWLSQAGLAVVQALEGVPQPVVVQDRPVTWWALLPEHRQANPAELGEVLRMFHALPAPSHLSLPLSDPFRDLAERIANATGLDPADQQWLAEHLARLRTRFEKDVPSSPLTVIHGDAWQGNVAVPESGQPILLDLESVALGHRDSDLISMAVDYTDFARLSESDYRSFVTAYGGHDVSTTPGYRTLADIRELRWLTFVLEKSDTNGDAAEETRHRIACLRGDLPRPWTWTAF
jgi:phosphotransferase family enzyme